jgi:ribosomal protein S13
MLQKKKNRELDIILSKNLTDKKLKTELKEIDLFSKKIKSYKGIRNKLKYPARGKRTHTNAKTKKKL